MALPALACGPGKVLFEDDFATIDPAWHIVPDASVAAGPTGVKNTVKPNFEGVWINQAGLYQDSQICMKVSVDFQPGDQPWYGVLFWATDKSNYYEVQAAPLTATYALGREQNNRYLQPIGWTGTKAYKQPANGENEIVVTLTGRRGILEINGSKVTDFNGQPPDGGGMIGLDFFNPNTSKSPATFTVKHIEVRALP
jgi:hypothetical protein